MTARTNPERMSPAERFAEIADLLATANRRRAIKKTDDLALNPLDQLGEIEPSCAQPANGRVRRPAKEHA